MNLFGGLAEEYKSFVPRKEVVKVFLPVSIFLLLGYAVFSFFDPKTYWQGYLMIADMLVVLSAYPLLKATKNVNIVANLLVFLALPIQLPWLVTGGYFGHGFFWTVAWVPWAFLLVGRKQGVFWVSTLVFASLVLIGLNVLGIVPIAYSFLELVQIFAMLFVATFLMYKYDAQREFFEELSFRAIEKLQKKK